MQLDLLIKCCCISFSIIINNGDAWTNPTKPYLKLMRQRLANLSVVEHLGYYDYGDSAEQGSSSSASDETSDAALTPMSCSNTPRFQDALKTLQRTYHSCPNQVKFNNCCQPKFLGLQHLEPPMYPMQGADRSLRHVYCDMETEGGGWMVISRRNTNSIHFIGRVKRYREGFGKVEREHWIGLNHMHHFTSHPSGTELRVELQLNGTKYVAHYDDFFVGNVDTNFTLRIGGYRQDKSNITDSLSYNNGSQFLFLELEEPKTENLLKTNFSSTSCNQLFNDWWHTLGGTGPCTKVALNKPIYKEQYARFSPSLLLVPRGYMWNVDGKVVGFDQVEMKIRPKSWECGFDRYEDEIYRLAFLSHIDPAFNPFRSRDARLPEIQVGQVV